MTRDGLAERFNLNEKETEGLVGELLSKGYIEPADNGMYRLTLKGNALSIARCMAPINREKADRIMGAIQRAMPVSYTHLVPDQCHLADSG